MMNLHTKFKFSVFTYYEDMKGNAKRRHWLWLLMGHPRSFAMSPFDRVHVAFYLTLIETMHLFCTVFMSNSHILTYPTCFGAPILVDPI